MEKYAKLVKYNIWGVLWIIWLLIGVGLEDMFWVVAVLAAAMIILDIHYLYRMRQGLTMQNDLLSDNNNMVLLLALGLERAFGLYSPEYIFILAVAVCGVVFDIYNRRTNDRFL